MRRLVAITVLLIGLGTPASADAPMHTFVPPIHHLVSAKVMAEWKVVAHCETQGDWQATGWAHEGGLGITPANWWKYGKQFAPVAWLATPEQQVWVATQIQKYGGAGNYVPDQHGTCNNW
jgi:hypothetical protein